MIICDNCHQHEARYIQKIVKGNTIFTVRLCEECARNLSAVNLNQNQSSNRRADVCPTCHTSLEEIAESGYLGCPNCYNYFRAETLKLISQMHNSRVHKGKKIDRSEKRDNKLSDYERLLGLLMQAREEGLDEEALRYEEFLSDMEDFK